MIRHDVALALLGLGAAAVLLGCFALVALPGPFVRLHATALASSLGLPLLALAVAVDTGPGRGAVKLLLIGALVAVSGPVTTMAIGKALREQRPPHRPAAREAARREPSGRGTAGRTGRPGGES
ncbi:cation:proton antiporter [Streptacidiphilus neutrinimicus]|uniref:cation:proton antiporter n=1 Tax=Streptacidiphilus neutrinimicus TaxID=105420 RepID=UPI0005A65E2C|nr:monovalent cation/H(+) antiporter subunit G [Streptacidiphilus neutrinimicus]